MNINSLRRLLKKFRKDRYTQKDISQMTGLSIRTVIRIENDKEYKVTKRTIKILQYEGII